MEDGRNKNEAVGKSNMASKYNGAVIVRISQNEILLFDIATELGHVPNRRFWSIHRVFVSLLFRMFSFYRKNDATTASFFIWQG